MKSKTTFTERLLNIFRSQVRIRPVVCKGTGNNLGGRVIAWEGIEPIKATCGVCGLECDVNEDYEQLWVVAAHLSPATESEER